MIEHLINLKNDLKGAFSHFMSTGVILRSPEVSALYVATCENCDQFNKESRRCNFCGCFMDIKSKVITTKCPLGRWEEKFVEFAANGTVETYFEKEKCCGGVGGQI